MRILAAIAVFGILYLSLFPFNFKGEPRRTGLTWTALAMSSDRVDIVANFIAYVPIGILGIGALRDRRWRSIALVAVGGALLSLGIEVAQLYLPSRSSSYRDLVCNAAGAFAGAVIAVSVRRFDSSGLALLPGARSAFFIACWFVWNTFPFMLSLRRSKLRGLWEQLQQWNWTPVEFVDCGLASFVLCAILMEDGKGRRSFTLWIAPAVVILPAALQFLVIDLPFSAVRTTAVMLGAGLALAAWKPDSRLHWSVLGCLLASWVMVRQLQPFEFSRIPAHFEWWPVEGVQSLDLSHYVRLIAGKLFLYGSVLAAFVSGGKRLVPVTALMAAAIGFTESLQRYIPGRTPEMTDVVLVVAAALSLQAARANRAANAPQ